MRLFAVSHPYYILVLLCDEPVYSDFTCTMWWQIACMSGLLVLNNIMIHLIMNQAGIIDSKATN